MKKVEFEVEKDIESYFCKKVKDLHGRAIKFEDPGRTGAPDRMILHNGHVFFVEFKRKGRKPRADQEKYRYHLHALGFRVYLCDSKKIAGEIVEHEFGLKPAVLGAINQYEYSVSVPIEPKYEISVDLDDPELTNSPFRNFLNETIQKEAQQHAEAHQEILTFLQGKEDYFDRILLSKGFSVASKDLRKITELKGLLKGTEVRHV
jgi:hypothetical protein